MYYFASDMHLGLDAGNPAKREKLLVRWLDEVSVDAKAIVLLGDVFDFWYEYKRVVPKGFTRFLGKLSELTDRGVQIHFFTGNHDIWSFDYLHTECGVTLHSHSEIFSLYGKKIFLAHGDNINISRQPMVRLMNRAFRSKTLQWIFSRVVHPDLALRLGHWWSGESRKSKSLSHSFRGEKESLVMFSREYNKCIPVDYFIYGHIHIAKDYDLGEGTRAIFLGEWIREPHYAVLSPDGKMTLKKYEA